MRRVLPARVATKRRAPPGAGPRRTRLWTRELSWSLRNLARNPRRSVVALLSIVAGVVAMILAGGFIEWNLWYGRESTIHSQLGHIRIFRPGYLASGFSDPYRYLLPGASPELAAIEARRDVTVVAPRISFGGLASLGDVSISFMGEGVDPARERGLSRAIEVRKGEDLSPAAPSGVTIGEGLAANLGAKVGDTLVMIAKTPSGGVNAAEVKVRGIFSSITRVYDDTTIRLPIALARQLTRTAGAHSWAILLDDTAATGRVTRALRAALPADQYEVVPWRDLADFYNKVEALYERQFGLVRLIIGLVIVLGITNTMMMNVLERTHEIGTALAIGRRRGGILREFVLEAALMGLLGSLIGAVIAAALARLISAVGIPMPPSPGMSHGFVAGIRLTPGLLLESVSVVLIASVLASLYPAWRASRLEIVDALRVGR